MLQNIEETLAAVQSRGEYFEGDKAE